MLQKKSSRFTRTIAGVLLIAAAFLLAACNSDGGEAVGTSTARPTGAPAATPTEGPTRTPQPAVNLFDNPGFEDDSFEPWFSMGTSAWGTPFDVSQAQALSGGSSSLLMLRSTDEGAGQARVYGVVQEISPDDFPDMISGSYYVDSWEKGTALQYVQFVVIVFDAENRPQEFDASNHQIRYPLAGIDEPPFEILNAKFIFVGRAEPEVGRWVSFERNIIQDFEEQWGAVPEGFSKIRILFEVRWDDRSDDDPPSSADVYFDDLYIGGAQ